MSLKNDKLFQLRVNDAFLRRIDEWRRRQDDLPSRSESLRRLVEGALDEDEARVDVGKKKGR